MRQYLMLSNFQLTCHNINCKLVFCCVPAQDFYPISYIFSSSFSCIFNLALTLFHVRKTCENTIEIRFLAVDINGVLLFSLKSARDFGVLAYIFSLNTRFENGRFSVCHQSGHGFRICYIKYVSTCRWFLYYFMEL